MDARKFFYACLIVSGLIVTAGLVFMFSACQQSPQTEQPTISSYDQLPTIPPEALVLKKQIEARGETVKLIVDYSALDAPTDIELSKIKANVKQGNGSYAELPKTYARIAGTSTSSGDCTCAKTGICEFFCGGKEKIIVTGIPDCCTCYQSFYGGGWIECNGGCPSRSVPCNYSN